MKKWRRKKPEFSQHGVGEDVKDDKKTLQHWRDYNDRPRT
jgi:hypothetical protein